jgi:RNA polymerase sigma-70 factor (ECF subfamily)
VLAVSDDPADGLQGFFLENREVLRRFLLARGAGDDCEDLLQDLWLKIDRLQTGPIAAPLPYLYRVANTLMIDRYRSARQSEARDAAWAELQSGPARGVSDVPSVERIVQSRQAAAKVEQALAVLPQRAALAFRRSRIDKLPQREIAAELGVSVSTVESDLRSVYRALAELKERLDED